MRVGLVGCGRIAERGYLPAIRQIGAELVGVADPEVERCADLAPGVRRFDSVEELVAAVPLDLVVLATPTAYHLDGARIVTAAGVPCLVEKPPAPNGLLAAELTRLDPVPWVGFNRRFEPALQEIRRRLQSCEGETRLELGFTIQRDAWAAHGGADGPLLDLGPHAVDLAGWITGQPIRRARVMIASGDADAFELELDSGSAAVIVAHDRGWREQIVARVDGRVVSTFSVGGLVGRARARIGRARGSTLAALLAAQLRAIDAAIAGSVDASPLATAHDGRTVMDVIDVVGRAGRGQTDWVAVDRSRDV